MSDSKKEPSSSYAVIRTAEWLRKQNLRAVPLHHQMKAAINENYMHDNYKSPDISFWKSGNYGIGCVLGPKAGGLIDGDLDSKESMLLAPRFLPPTTAIFGRKGKPSSHYLWRTEASSFSVMQFKDPVDQSVIMELRGDGGQTVFPGSLHQDTGELIEWSGEPYPAEIPTVSIEDLKKAAHKVCITALICRHIWAPGFHNEPCKLLAGLFFYLGWPIEDTIAVIEAVMDLTGDDDKSRIPTIRNTYKKGESGRKIQGAPKLREALKDDRVVDRILEWAGSPTVNLINEYNHRFAVVSVSGKFRIAEADAKPGTIPLFFQKDDWMNLMATDFSGLIDPDTEKPIPKYKLWINNDRRRAYRDVDFMPGVTDHPDTFNIWTGWAVEPAPVPDSGKMDEGCEAWLELLHEVICGGDDKLFVWFLNWFANIIRDPMQKAMTAPVLIGSEGAGKTFLTSYFGEILGDGYLLVSQPEHITGKFSAHLSTCLLLHSEEALYAGNPQHAAIIRSLITDNSQMMEKKGIDAKKTRNYLRLFLTSNKDNAAAAATGDRRYTVVDLKDRTLMHKPKLLARMLAEYNTQTRVGNGPASLMRYLLNMNYDPAIARVNVKNEDLLNLKLINASAPDGWWYQTLCNGTLFPDFLRWAVLPIEEPFPDWAEVVASPALYMAFVHFCKERNARNVPNETAFALHLSKMVGKKLQKAQRSFVNKMKGVDDKTVPVWVQNMPHRMNAIINMPTLAECRLAYERYLGQPVEWPLDDQPEPKPGTKKSVKPATKAKI